VSHFRTAIPTPERRESEIVPDTLDSWGSGGMKIALFSGKEISA
jgi:hypothetical protein